VDEAIARFMPEHAAKERERAAEQRYFSIDHDQVSFAGTSRVHGELDLADALDLEDAVQRGAEQLKVLGNEETLDVRRSLAVGMLARGQQALEFDETGVSAGSTTSGSGFEARFARTSTTGVRDVVLYVHLSEDALRSGDPDAPAWVENAGGQLVTAGQVAQWCGVSAGSTTQAAKVTVKPVVDLNQPLSSAGYQPSAAVVEHVRLRDRTCVHPWCQRPARSCDLDHIVPWDPDGPPGQTTTPNLALLCRRHHRLKTHGGWTYTMIQPGAFLWRSPYGHTWLRDRTGTTDLTPPPPEAPGHPPDR
jgi:hypothetical protein